jgi:hypothetical protein
MIKNLYRFLNPKYQKIFLEHKVNPAPRYGYGKPPHPELYEIVDSGRGSYQKFIEQILPLRSSMWEIKDSESETHENEPVWNNKFLPGLDIITLYSMVTIFTPSKYVEVGSGNSTRVALKAKHDFSTKTEIISIDPSPARSLEGIADEIYREHLENFQISLPDLLSEGDILYMDGSHRVFPNSDCMTFFLEVLPRLKNGVIVHLHDIYIPYDYPQFMCDRFYNEQYSLAVWLMGNQNRFEIMMPNYFISMDNELSGLLSPVWDHPNLRKAERHGGSFWFRIIK